MTSILVLRTLRWTRPARLAQRVETLAPLAALGLIGLGVVGFGAQWRMARDPAGGATAAEQPAVAVARESAWVELTPAGPALKLDDPRFAGASVKFSGRRRGDQREDFVTLGGFDGDSPFAAFIVARSSSAPAQGGASSFYVEIARRAAPLGLSLERADLPILRDSRLGPAETAGLILGAGQGRRRNCRGLRLGAEGLDLTGLVCLPEGQKFSDRDLICLLDGLEPTPAGDLGAFFLATAGLRAVCAAPSAAPVAADAPHHGKKAEKVAGKPRPR